MQLEHRLDVMTNGLIHAQHLFFYFLCRFGHVAGYRRALGFCTYIAAYTIVCAIADACLKDAMSVSRASAVHRTYFARLGMLLRHVADLPPPTPAPGPLAFPLPTLTQPGRSDCVPTISFGSLHGLFRTLRNVDRLPLDVYQRAGFILDSRVRVQQSERGVEAEAGHDDRRECFYIQWLQWCRIGHRFVGRAAYYRSWWVDSTSGGAEKSGERTNLQAAMLLPLFAR